MVLKVKRFKELSVEELQKIYKLRVMVFVVEQECPYQEVDDIDIDAYHVYFEEENDIKAYLRIVPSASDNETVVIGRVISTQRRSGLGSKILLEGIRVAKNVCKAHKIDIEAQVHALDFYKKLGFKEVSTEYFIDGLPHIKMELDI